MTTTTAPQVVTPSAVLQFTKQMQLLEKQMVQQLAQVNKALMQVGTAFAKQVAEMSRAQMFLVEQYQKSARAKQKRAHQHLTQYPRGNYIYVILSKYARTQTSKSRPPSQR